MDTRNKHDQDGQAPANAIFVAGSPRSGTILLRNFLNRHPQLAVCRETEFYHYVCRRRDAFGDLSDPRNRERACPNQRRNALKIAPLPWKLDKE